MRLAREAIDIGQSAFAEQYGLNVRTYRKNETGLNEAGICLGSAFIRAGINANWILTGEGPMLLAELAPPPAKPVAPRINIEALAAIIEGALKAAPDASMEQIAQHSVRFYVQCIEDGLITPDGVGQGKHNDAA